MTTVDFHIWPEGARRQHDVRICEVVERIWQAGREVEVHATRVREQGMDGGAEAGGGRVVGDGGAEDGADFLLHRASMFGGAQAEAVPGGVVEVSDGEGGHGDDCAAVNAGKIERGGPGVKGVVPAAGGQ